VNRFPEVLRGAVSTIGERLSEAVSQSERTILLGTVLLASAVSAVTGFVLTQYYSVDVLSSLGSLPGDCFFDWSTQIGRHCFSDYADEVALGMMPNPWVPYTPYLHSSVEMAHNTYPAAAMAPHMIFGLLGKWLHAPRLGLLAYLLALTIACLTPSVWAARGTRGLERVVVFVALGAAAIPAWATIDRGNSVGFVVPIALVFLVAVCRRRWGLAAVMVMLAAMVKPHFAVLAVVFFAARQWRLGTLAAAGVLISNVGMYLLWPRYFPETIAQSIRNIMFDFGSYQNLVDPFNISFGRGLLWIPDYFVGNVDTATGFLRVGMANGFLAGPRSQIGYVILLLVIVSVVALGRRIPPVMVAIALLAAASFFPAASSRYYLVFVLPVAALLVRDPDGLPGSGIFDRHETLGDRRHAVGICVSLATALSIAQIAVLVPPIQAPIAGQNGAGGIVGHTSVAFTTAALTPVLWLVVCAAIIVSYARRPAPVRIDRPPILEEQVLVPGRVLDSEDATANSSPRAAPRTDS
jgi:hypothetical protein